MKKAQRSHRELIEEACGGNSAQLKQPTSGNYCQQTLKKNGYQTARTATCCCSKQAEYMKCQQQRLRASQCFVANQMKGRRAAGHAQRFVIIDK